MTGQHDILQLRSLADLDLVLEEWRTRLVLIFKHSYTCGTSAAALDELLECVADSPADVRYVMVTVQTERRVSAAITEPLVCHSFSYLVFPVSQSMQHQLPLLLSIQLDP